MRSCVACGTAIDLDSIGVRDTCPQCRAYLHACRCCDFYAPGLSRDCREPAAELVADKEQGNFCDFFRWDPARPMTTGTTSSSAARDKLEALFRKAKG